MNHTKDGFPVDIFACIFLAIIVTFDHAEFSIQYGIVVSLLSIAFSVIFALVEIGLKILGNKTR